MPQSHPSLVTTRISSRVHSRVPELWHRADACSHPSATAHSPSTFAALHSPPLARAHPSCSQLFAENCCSAACVETGGMGGRGGGSFGVGGTGGGGGTSGGH
eukprot:4221977-Prymnesium_polylepis.1